jgi:hypothetical protein
VLDHMPLFRFQPHRKGRWDMPSDQRRGGRKPAKRRLRKSSVTSRPLKGDAPAIELVLGYKKSNESPILKLLLSRLDELVTRVSKKTR